MFRTWFSSSSLKKRDTANQQEEESPLSEQEAKSALPLPLPLVNDTGGVVSEENAISTMEPFKHSTSEAPRVTFPPLPKQRLFSSLAETTGQAKTRERMGRHQSMSRVFTELPDRLPTYCDTLVDQLEFWCHVMLLERKRASLVQQQECVEHVLMSLANFQSGRGDTTSDSTTQVVKAGRVFSRMQLAALAADVAYVCEEDDALDPSLSSAPNSRTLARRPCASDWTLQDWTTLREQVITVRDILLRQTANLAPVVSTATTTAQAAVAAATALELDEDDGRPDPILAQHTIMTVEYHDVLQLLSVQCELARVRQALSELQTQQQSQGNDSTTKDLNEQVKKVVNQYIENLAEIFPNDPVAPCNEDDDVAELDESCHSNNSPTDGIPKKLMFVLTDLYSPKKHHHEGQLVERLLEHVYKIASDTQTEADELTGQYTYANLQQSIRALLLKWSETILDIPTLVKLQYWDVPSPFVEKDGDDMSAFGESQDDARERTQSMDILQEQAKDPQQLPPPPRSRLSRKGSHSRRPSIDRKQAENEPMQFVRKQPRVPPQVVVPTKEVNRHQRKNTVYSSDDEEIDQGSRKPGRLLKAAIARRKTERSKKSKRKRANKVVQQTTVDKGTTTYMLERSSTRQDSRDPPTSPQLNRRVSHNFSAARVQRMNSGESLKENDPDRELNASFWSDSEDDSVEPISKKRSFTKSMQ